MRRDELTSDSGFVDDVVVTTSNAFTDIEPLYSNPKTHSRLFTATLRGKRFVLKALKEEYSAHPSYRELLNKEFEIGYRLSHPNIAATLGMHNVEGIGEVIAIEYVDGITLAEALNNGSVNNDIARQIVAEVCDALHYMHALQVIHRDLKPENIMLTHNGNHVKIIDFGLADSDTHTIFKQPAGTRRYASPELVDGQKIDNRSDIYSLGIIIGMMLHSRRARRVAHRCISEKREARYADADDVKSALLRPSHRREYAYLALSSVAIVAAGIIAYNIGAGSATKGDSKSDDVVEIVQVVENENSEVAQYEQLVVEVDTLMDSLFTNYYSRLSGIKTQQELDRYSSDYAPLIERVDSLVAAKIDAYIDPQSKSHATYKSLIEQHVEQQTMEYYRRYEPATTELITRIFLK